MNSLIKLARLQHYIKNLLLFVPWGLSLDFSTDAFFKVILGFISFSLVASFGYVVNDILDVQSDRLHHLKKYRPIAQGNVSIVNALIFAFTLLATGLLLGFFVNLEFGILLLTYVVLNLLYSIRLKSVKWIDVALLSAFFIIRLYAGSIASSTLLSNWFLITCIIIFLMMSVDKRHNELLHGENKRRAYKLNDIEVLLSYRSALLIGLLVCVNLYMNDLNASGILRVIFTLVTFVLFTTYLENKSEDQVSKVLDIKFIVNLFILVFLYLLIKKN